VYLPSPFFGIDGTHGIEAAAVGFVGTGSSSDAEKRHYTDALGNLQQSFHFVLLKPFHGSRVIAQGFSRPHHGGKGNHDVPVCPETKGRRHAAGRARSAA